jgi:LysM repeat protein
MKRTGGVLLILLVVCGLALALVPFSQAQTPPQAQAPADDTYVVKKGDTLWDIAKQLYSDPLYWQSIWNRNPFIANPNRIFPGDTLALPGKTFAPATPVAEAAKAEPGMEAAKEAAQEEAKAAEPPKPTMITDYTPPPPIPVASQQALLCSPVLVADKSVERVGIGTVVAEVGRKTLLAQEDQVFLQLDPAKEVRVGDRLTVLRPSLRMVHPSTRQRAGRVLNTGGVVEVTGLREGVVVARVIFGCDPITLGDRVTPFSVPPFPPAEKVAQPATRQLEGTVINAMYMLEVVAQQQVVFMDVGKGQGVNPGDVFAIYRSSRPAVNLITDQLVGIPPERRAEATVLRVTESTATAVISDSTNYSQAGDRVVLTRQMQP